MSEPLQIEEILLSSLHAAESLSQPSLFVTRNAHMVTSNPLVWWRLLSWGCSLWEHEMLGGLNRTLLTVVFVSSCNVAFGFDMTSWDKAYDAKAGTRYIPVELWTGAEWSGRQVLAMSPADLSFGGGSKHLHGPINYTLPDSKTTIQVYERTNKSKRQLFALVNRDDGIQGLGRVYDNRYDRYCPDEIKMPLGVWHENESRSFDVHCGNRTRHYSITIEQLDGACGFFNANAHCLRFHWLVDGGDGKGTDMHYTYAPGKGLLNEEGNE